MKSRNAWLVAVSLSWVLVACGQDKSDAETASEQAETAAYAAEQTAAAASEETHMNAKRELIKKKAGEKEHTNMTAQPVTASLQAKLDERRNNFEASATQDKIDVYARGIEDTAQSGVLEAMKREGDLAPTFQLPNPKSEQVSSQSLLEDGPVVLIWYRGGWCPYCNIQLASYQALLPEIKALGAELVAISPEIPDQSLSTQEKNELNFHVLSDVNNTVAREFGVVYTVHDDVLNFLGDKLEEHQGDGATELPLAATYVIDRNGRIAFAHADKDYRVRAEPAEVLTVLRELQASAT